VDKGGQAGPFFMWGKQFQDLDMPPRQPAVLPPHALASADQEMAAMCCDVLANVEDQLSQAALAELAFQATMGISQAAPVDFPGNLPENLQLLAARK